MRQEPELAHPFRRPSTASVTSTSSKVSSAEKAHAKSLRNAGKEAFLTVVRETVEELAVEAAAEALEDHEARTDGMHRRDRSSGSNRSHSHRRSSSRASHRDRDRDLAPGQTIRAGVGPSQDSASGSPFRPSSSSRGGGDGGGGHSRRSSRGGDDDEPSDRRRRRSRNTSMGQGEGQSIVAAAMATFGGGIGSANSGGDKPRSFKAHGNGHRRAASQASSLAADRAVALEEQEEQEQEQTEANQGTSETMADDEKETLLELLSGAYGQVNDLTDELKISLDKLSDAEKELKRLARSQSNPQLLPKPSPTSDLQSPKDTDMDDTDEQKRKPVSKILKGMFPSDEGAKSTPAAVRQLQMEVQRLRQRNAQAHAKEEKHKSDMSHMQRLMAVMESQINKADQDKKNASNASTSRSAKQPPEGTYCMTPGGTRYQDGVTKPLVARVAELEEKLVQCSMENATAKQEHLTAQLNGQKLEKTLQKLRHELAKSRAMNDLLQNEIDRLQGHEPEGEADGSGWRRWLGGLQEPLSPDPNPIEVNGDSDSPVVVVRDLDNNQLVYAPSRSQFS